MGEIECKPSTQVMIQASNNDLKQAPSPFFNVLTRIHSGYFRISISLGSQALLWKILTEPNGVPRDVLHVFSKLPSTVCLLLWCLAVLSQLTLSFLYILRCYHHFHLVKAEFSHNIGVNYLYAPWISWLILLQSAPILLSHTSIYYMILCWVFIVPLAMLDIKIYGQWFTTEKRFLSVMANPTSQISVIANLVAARAAAHMGWKESAVCMWSLGMVHYLVLFVTLYQRLSGRNSLPLTLRPTFFLFFAAPSMAGLAWNSITGSFDTMSKMLFFFSLFLFVSLVCRPFLFKKSMRKFNVAWWAYSFPLSFIALSAIEYARELKCHVATLLMLVLSVLSVLVFLGLMMLTAANSISFLAELMIKLLPKIRNQLLKPKSRSMFRDVHGLNSAGTVRVQVGKSQPVFTMMVRRGWAGTGRILDEFLNVVAHFGPVGDSDESIIDANGSSRCYPVLFVVFDQLGLSLSYKHIFIVSGSKCVL